MNGLVSPESLAAEFGGNTTRRKIVDWTRQYGWPHVRVGRTIAFLPADVDQILAKHHIAGSGEHDEDCLPGQTALSAARSA